MGNFPQISSKLAFKLLRNGSHARMLGLLDIHQMRQKTSENRQKRPARA